MTEGAVPYIGLSPEGAAWTGTLDLAVQPGSPLVSCVMATRGRAFPAIHAVRCFQAQTYPDRELVIACATAESEVEALVARLGDARIRFVQAPAAATVGDLRNAAIAQASGTLVCVWDDDDLSHVRRLEWQVAALGRTGAGACFLSHLLLWWPQRRRIAVSGRYVWENTMLAAKARLPSYPSQPRGGDTVLVHRLRASSHLTLIEQPIAYCYVAHGANLWGADHFEMLFGHALRAFEGAEYDAVLAKLSRQLPLAAYAAAMPGG